LIANKVAVNTNVPIVASPRGNLFPWNLKKGYLKKKLYMEVFQRRYFNTSDCIHVTSKEELRAVKNLGLNAPIGLISNGVDIIWVIDPSGSMTSHRTRLLSGISDMMSSLPSVSWRLVIISADPTRSVNSTEFPLLPGDSAADAQAMYSSSVLGGLERGFESVYRYIEDNSFSSSWMREDASLLVLFVSDEEEQSTSMFPMVSDFTDWLDEQRNSVYVASIVNHDPAISSCNSRDIDVGHRYMDAANYYSGQVLDICSEDWSGGVLDAANGAVPYSSYPLSHVPLYTDNIVVFVDGVVYHDAYWDYVSASNRIDFILEPPGGSLVEIAYHY